MNACGSRESKTGPAKAGYCSAAARVWRCGSRVGSVGVGRAAGWAAESAWRADFSGICGLGPAAELFAGLVADAAHDQLDVVPADPTRQFGGVGLAQGVVLDLGDHGDGAAQCLHLALGGVQVVFGEQAANDELVERDSAGDQVADRAVAAALAQFARVEAVGGDGDVGLPGQFLVAGEGLQGGGLTGGVTVEGVDDLAAPEVVVHQQAAQDRHVLVAEGGTAGRHSGFHARHVHGHHVGVALDDHGLMAFRDLTLGQIEPEEHLGLLVQQRFRGVDVLGGHGVVVVEAARAEADHLAAEIADRPQQAAVETVHRAALALLGQARRFQLFELKTLAQQVFRQGVPPAGA